MVEKFTKYNMSAPHNSRNPSIKGKLCSYDTWSHRMQPRRCVALWVNPFLANPKHASFSRLYIWSRQIEYPGLYNLLSCTRRVIGVLLYPQARDKPHYVILITWYPSVSCKALEVYMYFLWAPLNHNRELIATLGCDKCKSEIP
jgi:hypothetical protein